MTVVSPSRINREPRYSGLMRALKASLGLLFAAVVLSGCGGDDGFLVITGRFAGQANGSSSFVAVQASAPVAGSDDRVVKIYVTNGTSISEFFTGTVNGNVVSLQSEDNDSSVSALILSDHSEGTISLPGNQSVSFSIGRALGLAGLYDVTIADTGEITGTAPTGTLTAEFTGEQQDGRDVISGTITAGTVSDDFEALATTDAAGQHRWIVISGPRVKGAIKQGQGVGFVDEIPIL